jgi:hypothetical protein
MIRKIMLLLLLLGMFWISSCATDSYKSSSDSNNYPSYPFTYKDMCGFGAVYCGPGP